MAGAVRATTARLRRTCVTKRRRGWRFEWLRSWDEIWDPVNLDDWRATIAGGDEVHATPFMHPDLVRAWLEATGGEAAYLPYFLRATHVSGQKVLWLLVRARAWWRTGLLRQLMPVGGDLFDYHDPIVAPARRAGGVLAPGFWPALEAELRRHEGAWFDHCSFSRIRPGLLRRGRLRAARAGPPRCVRLDAYPDFAAYMAARRGSINKLARKQRKLAASGAARFRVYGPADLDAVLAWLPALEAAYRARYPEGAVTPAFLSSLVRHGLPSGVVHCSALELDGRPFSWHLGFHLNRVHYDYLCGFDAGYARLSPGLMHVHGLIEWLYAESDARVFDFLLGSEGYKARLDRRRRGDGVQRRHPQPRPLDAVAHLRAARHGARRPRRAGARPRPAGPAGARRPADAATRSVRKADRASLGTRLPAHALTLRTARPHGDPVFRPSRAVGAGRRGVCSWLKSFGGCIVRPGTWNGGMRHGSRRLDDQGTGDQHLQLRLGLPLPVQRPAHPRQLPRGRGDAHRRGALRRRAARRPEGRRRSSPGRAPSTRAAARPSR